MERRVPYLESTIIYNTFILLVLIKNLMAFNLENVGALNRILFIQFIIMETFGSEIRTDL